ncbi:PIN domain-containing protein [Methylovulum psychrotolerans]|uniref:PIN domain-containing protein n=1 Tax=Methylovulum psychrotolerans TaxID=1704499 RepID=A0A2S5CFU8_9GAMM|nr:type II toxin-antitoxin system VapC family toxin [Methylovulum psychrotolerans]MBT9100476.1 type II toxin-antitoxin system VapC family toxin [Methylovulum psychrotolerans]POZ49612.1 PIN domain-containing protein [Methylovulum psychrotolerans]
MIALDTNIWIRYIAQDDEEQAQLATDLIENQCSAGNPAFINEITLCEIVWVLKRAYRYDKKIILTVLKQLLNGNEVFISSYPEAWAAYYDYETGNADFSDYFIAQLNKKYGCPITFSFDKKACQHSNFKLLNSKICRTDEQ